MEDDDHLAFSKIDLPTYSVHCKSSKGFESIFFHELYNATSLVSRTCKASWIWICLMDWFNQ